MAARTKTPAPAQTLVKQVTLSFDKETPHKVRYADSDPDSVLSLVYVGKEAFPDGDTNGYPQTITVTISVA